MSGDISDLPKDYTMTARRIRPAAVSHRQRVDYPHPRYDQDRLDYPHPRYDQDRLDYPHPRYDQDRLDYPHPRYDQDRLEVGDRPQAL